MAKLGSSKDAAASQFDFQKFTEQFNSLDWESRGDWPLSVKLTLGILLFVLILALAYFVPVNKVKESIQASEAEQVTLLDTYRQKESKARNLQKYQALIQDMEAEFNQLLDRLPKETKIPELVEDINMRGVGSGVEFNNIDVENEITKELFIEQPIVINASGDYHEFGNFVSGIADLARIITIGDFDIENTVTDLNQLPALKLELHTNTYRSKDDSETTDDTAKESK